VPTSHSPSDDASVLPIDLQEADAFLRRLARRLCHDAADAHDLVQDTFERALLRTHEQPRNPRAWLASIMHNLFVDRCRAKARRPLMEAWNDEITAAQPPDAGGEPGWADLSLDDVRAALDQLEPRFRDVYVLHTFERRSYREIADHFAMRSVTVGTRLNRARRMLREILSSRMALSTAS